MNKLNEIINREASKFKAPLEADGLNLLIQNVALEFAKHILEEAYLSATCSNKPKFEGDINYQVDEESITNVLNKYL